MQEKGALRRPRIYSAFAAVPRHLFLPGIPLEQVYADAVVPLKYDSAGMVVSSSSQPTMMAIMLDQLALKPGDNVLEIGTASGFNAALMQQIVGDEGRVTTIEIDPDLASRAEENLARARMQRVLVVQADGAQGYAPRATYDHIVVTAGVWDVPPAWRQQLKPNGTIVVPIWIDGVQVSGTFSVEADGTLVSSDNRPCAFVYLRGDAAGPDPRRRIGSTSLMMLGESVAQIDPAAMHLLLSDDYDQTRLSTMIETSSFWGSFQLYLMLNPPLGFSFALYTVSKGQKAYGLEGEGVVLFGPGSAAFASYEAAGTVQYYGGADAMLALQQAQDEWLALGQPPAERLRLRLIPLAQADELADEVPGRYFRRRFHVLHAWLDV